MDPRLIVQSFFDTEHLGRLAATHSDGYQNAEPFPHIVIDDFLPAELFEAVVAELPGPDEIAWDVYTDRGNTKKLATQNVALMGPVTRSLFAEFSLTPMIAFLESLTGIAGLVPDPHLVGGGLHMIETGGFLKVHADFNVHSHLQLDRRLNLLLYLNPDWDESWGGHLELWSRDMSACERRIAPIANRCVMFNTTSSRRLISPRSSSGPVIVEQALRPRDDPVRQQIADELVAAQGVVDSVSRHGRRVVLDCEGRDVDDLDIGRLVRRDSLEEHIVVLGGRGRARQHRLEGRAGRVDVHEQHQGGSVVTCDPNELAQLPLEARGTHAMWDAHASQQPRAVPHVETAGAVAEQRARRESDAASGPHREDPPEHGPWDHLWFTLQQPEIDDHDVGPVLEHERLDITKAVAHQVRPA
jgi:hypothetical protein